MVRPMSWEDFLQKIADAHGLTADQRETLLARLAEHNRDKSETAVAISMELDIPAFKKRMTAVYEKFARSCPELDSGGRGKLEKLRAWLVKEYEQWKETGKLIMPEEGEKPEDLPRKTIEANKSPYPEKLPQITRREQHIASNPFGKKGRITNPDEFFGRKELLHRLFEYLAKNGNCVLVGDRQMGKSSILSMVSHWGPQLLNLPPESFIEIDMANVYDEDDFFRALCDELDIPTCRGYELAKTLRGKRYILCLDTFERQKKDRFTGDEWWELRGLADGDRVPFKLVLASRLPLNQVFENYPQITSPLENICRQLNVEPFSEKEAREFLDQRLRGTGVSFTESEINQLLEETKCHPARLQQKAASVYNGVMDKNKD